MLVRLAELGDLSAINGFDPFSGDRVVEIMDRRMLVADVAGTVQGYIAWQRNGFIGKDYITKLVTAETYRHRGLATKLIAALSMVLSGRIFVSAAESNLAAMKLFQSTSWTMSGALLGILPSDQHEVFFYKDL